MKNAEFYKNKNVAVVGLARSGLACANLLYDLGAKVYVTEANSSDAVLLNASRLRSKQISRELGVHSEGFIKGKDLVVISPGVTGTAQPVVWARQYGVPVISEIEFSSSVCPAEIIAITGSNGKTTVTSLIGRILEEAGKRVFVCGNIGNPFSGEVSKMKEGDYVSLEVSSFQLEHIKGFKPKISLILNFTRNHLDRYSNMQEYLDAKKRIFLNQDKNDYLVLNFEDETLRELAKKTNTNVEYFSKDHGLNPNEAAAFTVGKILGLDEGLMRRVFGGFKGIEHRLEFVTEINNVKFINDSKATTADSTIWALNNIHKPVVLIAGGKDKGIDYNQVLGPARKKVRNVVLIGEAKKKIGSVFKGVLSMEEAASLDEAVLKAFKSARPGDCVLLSPMCSSFDMFSNFEERGDRFKKAVLELARNEKRNGP